MQGQVSRTTMIVAAVIAVLVCGALGWMAISKSAPTPPPGYQPVMPPSGYAGSASGIGASMRKTGAPAPTSKP